MLTEPGEEEKKHIVLVIITSEGGQGEQLSPRFYTAVSIYRARHLRIGEIDTSA